MRTDGPHFFVPPAAIDDTTATIVGEEAHHLTAVLRTGADDPVSVSDGAGRLFQGRVVEVGRDVRVALVDAAEVPRPQPLVRVVHALPPGSAFDELVRWLAELGVDEIAPVTTTGTDTASEAVPGDAGADARLARWRAIVHAAAKHSKRAWLPEVLPVVPWVEAFPPGDAGAVCWEQAIGPLREAVGDVAQLPRVTVGVGPPDGLTADEVAETGLPAGDLGSFRVLRSERTGVVAAAVMLTLAGRLG